MKYRFQVSKKRLPSPQDNAQKNRSVKRSYRLRGRNTLRGSRETYEPIDLSSLFEIGELPEGQAFGRSKKAFHRKAMGETLKNFSENITQFARRFQKNWERASKKIRSVGEHLREKYKKRKARKSRKKEKTIHALPVLSGALCAALLVSTVCAGGVLLGLFAPYGRSYKSVVIPDFLGKAPTSVLENEGSPFNLIIQYEYNPDYPEGTVISQSPASGITRRIYGKDGYCTVVLTVSRQKEPYVLENLVGMTQRDALLLLKNHEIDTSVTEVYSNTAPRGTVLESIPPSGTALTDKDSVLLRVSVGKKITNTSVPNLVGITEAQANALLQASGLSSGKVSYQTSSYAVGTVIAQSVSPYTSVQQGALISYTVSAGDRYSIKTVPDLYGMTASEAAETLRKYGLLIGSTYPVANAAPKGTVIAQSPISGTPITPSTVTVNIYISS